MKTHRTKAFSLIELLAVVAMLGLVAAVLFTRTEAMLGSADSAICDAHVAEIEVQAQRWRRTHGAWPSANLNELVGPSDYFPAGLPVCPVDGAAYTLDANGRVSGHIH